LIQSEDFYHVNYQSHEIVCSSAGFIGDFAVVEMSI